MRVRCAFSYLIHVSKCGSSTAIQRLVKLAKKELGIEHGTVLTHHDPEHDYCREIAIF